MSDYQSLTGEGVGWVYGGGLPRIYAGGALHNVGYAYQVAEMEGFVGRLHKEQALVRKNPLSSQSVLGERGYRLTSVLVDVWYLFSSLT